MMTRRFMLVVVLIGLACLPALAGNTGSNAAVTNRFEAMDEATLQKEMNRLLDVATNQERLLRLVRSRAMTQDKELVKLNKELREIQEKISKRLAEEHPELSTFEQNKQAAITEHKQAREALKKLRSREQPKPAGE